MFYTENIASAWSAGSGQDRQSNGYPGNCQPHDDYLICVCPLLPWRAQCYLEYVMEKEFRRARLYDFIERFTIARNQPPTYADIASALDISNRTIHTDLTVLKARGCVDWIPNTPWSIRITGPYRLHTRT